MTIFEQFLLDNYVDFVSKTSRDKVGASANKKRKRCNRIASDRTLGRNNHSAGYVFYVIVPKKPVQMT
mgnify:CR=1 FL=1